MRRANAGAGIRRSAALAALLAVWESLSRAGWLDPFYAPPPSAVGQVAFTLAAGGELWPHLGATAAAALAGLLAGLGKNDTDFRVVLGWRCGFIDACCLTSRRPAAARRGTAEPAGEAGSASVASARPPSRLADSAHAIAPVGGGQQPVVKRPAAFERQCIPPDCVVRRLPMPDMRPSHALSGGRLAALRATPPWRRSWIRSRH